MVRRVAASALVIAMLVAAVAVGVLVYHAAQASRARDADATPAVTAAFREATRAWLSQIDLPVHRVALVSAEEYGSGNYIFIFDVYGWFGIGSGYATYRSDTTDHQAGGLLRDGGVAGFAEHASESGLESTRAAWLRIYGEPRRVTLTSPQNA